MPWLYKKGFTFLETISTSPQYIYSYTNIPANELSEIGYQHTYTCSSQND